MSAPIQTELNAYYKSPGSKQTAFLLRIVRNDRHVYAFTSHDRPIFWNDKWYSCSPGLDVSSIVHSSGFNVDNLEITTLNDGTTFTKKDLFTGAWKNAKFYIHRYKWSDFDPENVGVEPIMSGTLGELEVRGATVVVELRGLQQYLQQPVGIVTTPTCRAKLGDSSCKVNLLGTVNSLIAGVQPVTVTGTVVSVSGPYDDRLQFSDAVNRVEPSDWFTEGIVTWNSGANTGQSMRVRKYLLGSVPGIVLAMPMLQSIAIGDAYTMVAGCRLSRGDDCRDKFRNILNFQGEPDLPGVDAMSMPP